MGKLIKEWVKGILTEGIEKKVVVYAGRFQPFHKGHYLTYDHLVKQFGKDNVYMHRVRSFYSPRTALRACG